MTAAAARPASPPAQPNGFSTVSVPKRRPPLGERAWPRRKPGYELTGKPRLTPPCDGSGQREVTTLPRV